MTVTRSALANELLDRLGWSSRTCHELVDIFFAEICAGLAAGDKVQLPRFGVFVLREKKARPGRNPRTGEPRDIAARRVVTFKGSHHLRKHCSRRVYLPPMGRGNQEVHDQLTTVGPPPEPQ